MFAEEVLQAVELVKEENSHSVMVKKALSALTEHLHTLSDIIQTENVSAEEQIDDLQQEVQTLCASVNNSLEGQLSLIFTSD